MPPEDHVPSERAAGDDALLEDTYRHERSWLLSLASARGARQDAEDIVQHAFVRLAERDVRAVRLPRAYLGQAVRNLVRDRQRRAERRSEHDHHSLDEVELADGDQLARLEARDRLRRIERALEKLKPLTRQIFLASRVDGYSYTEIASETGLSVKGVEKQMSKALKILARDLRGHE
ncbi:RNA polymerase sigma factor [Novosphingobium profundi]|uniref:RNA polymerase sigma factor n=1 Tax=Novosphingobium profundi TaxID=1774954 RepID=UPI001FE45C1A|nr:sigma-70 family RNA polymerase sigma factor [Novosphingobium profundi]